jgi:mono/diheme cytochrome c family protein
MWTAASLRDAALKARVVRLSAWWVLAAAISVPMTLVWFLAAASSAGVPVAEIFGAAGSGIGALLTAVFGATTSGYPVAQRAAFWLVLVSIALVAATVLAVSRGARLGRPLAALMLVLGLVAMGGGEFVREDLRKPYVIGHYMFVSGVRVPDQAGVIAPPADHVRTFGPDRFTIDALNQTGVLHASAWVRPVPDSMIAPAHYAEKAAHQGRELFRSLCAACHTIDGYLAIRPLVRGKSVDAIDGMLQRLATPVDASGAAVAWNAPALQLRTWRSRRMPPFVGTPEERRLLAAHLALLGGATPAAVAAPDPAATGAASIGQTHYDANCAACHAPDAMAPFDHDGRNADALYEMIGRLPKVNEMMPAFEGTDAERRALAEYLASLPRPQKKGGAQ